VSEERPAGDGLLAGLVKVLAAFGAVAAANAGRRAAGTLLGYLFVAGLFVVSLCFLTAAGYRALTNVLDESVASLIVGCVYLVAGLALALVLQLRRR
jgi:hypothetical protein